MPPLPPPLLPRLPAPARAACHAVSLLPYAARAFHRSLPAGGIVPCFVARTPAASPPQLRLQHVLSATPPDRIHALHPIILLNRYDSTIGARGGKNRQFPATMDKVGSGLCKQEAAGDERAHCPGSMHPKRAGLARQRGGAPPAANTLLWPLWFPQGVPYDCNQAGQMCSKAERYPGLW